MSTNYYLINKEKKKINNELDEIIKSSVQVLKNNLNQFFISKGLTDKLEDVKSSVNSFGVYSDEMYLDDSEIICNTVYRDKQLICRWGFWKCNKEDFAEYFQSLQCDYTIENEYGEEFGLVEFIRKINGL